MNIQTYCDLCKKTVWFELDLPNISFAGSGIVKRSLVHNDHVLNCEIDIRGSVRSARAQQILENPTVALSRSVARSILELNAEKGQTIRIDVYTSNPELSKFFSDVLSKMINQVSELEKEGRGYFDIHLTNKLTILKTHRFDISIGLNIRMKEENLSSLKGLILDMGDVEKNKVDLEIMVKNQDFVGILTHKDTKDPYFHAISSLCLSYGIPFYLDSLSTNSLRGLFDFIYAVLQTAN